MTSLRDSAVVLLWRPAASGSGREVLWLRRGMALSFGGGFYAFPGGKLEPGDSEIPVVGATGMAAALRACAVRECFEETGLLLARGADELSPTLRGDLRARLSARAAGFASLLAEQRLTLHSEDLVDAGRWITPPFYPSRFDTRLFLGRAPAPSIDLASGEASEGGFIAPREALGRWRSGTALLHPPSWNAFIALEEPDLDQALKRLREPPLVENHIASRIEFQEGIVLIPQRTPTLPPATHTNAYLLGTSQMVLVDPGSRDEGELARLVEVTRRLTVEGRRPIAIALTHHHHDHVGGVAMLQAELHLPVWAHAAAAAQLREVGISPARLLADGEPLGLADFPLTALHTPGHTRGHLTFWHEPSKAAVVGDSISSVSTIVIDPPEGHMGDYLASLERLLALEVRTLYPAHGPAIADGTAKLREYLAHRRDRERQIIDAVRAGASTPAEIVPRVYQGTPEFLFPYAERSVQAHLDKLASEGQVEVRAERYRARGST